MYRKYLLTEIRPQKKYCALSKEALKNKTRKDDHVGIGYFSGSLTHNDDFELVLPALTKVMEKYPQVQLHVVGELDLPETLQQYKACGISSVC